MGRLKKNKLLMLSIMSFAFCGVYEIMHFIEKYLGIDPVINPLREHILYSGILYLLICCGMIIFQRRKIIFCFLWLYLYAYGSEAFWFSGYNGIILSVQIFIPLCIALVIYTGTIIYVFKLRARRIKAFCRLLWLVSMVSQVMVSVVSALNTDKYSLSADMYNTAWILTILVIVLETMPFLRVFRSLTKPLTIMISLLILSSVVYAYALSLGACHLPISILTFIPYTVMAIMVPLYIALLRKRGGQCIGISKCVVAVLVASCVGIGFAWMCFG